MFSLQRVKAKFSLGTSHHDTTWHAIVTTSLCIFCEGKPCHAVSHLSGSTVQQHACRDKHDRRESHDTCPMA